MKLQRKILQIVLLSSLLCIPGCVLDLRPLSDTLDTEISQLVEKEFDGMIVYVNQGNESKLYSAGWKNRENKIPADPHALFKIASISKLYIAAATVKLVADGQLSLDDRLSQLIPEVSGKIENADVITLKLLLKHRSGIPEFIYHPDFGNRDPEESYLATASLIYDQPADFEPDQKYKYSNTNYLLIGEILDRTLGYSHHLYIKNEILLPLGLTNTYSLYSEVDPEKVMSGYYKGYESDLKANDYTRPGGSMVATAEDVGLFLRALIDGTLLTPEEQYLYSSVHVYEHTGWLGGYTSIARYHKDIDAVVIQFVNTSGKEIFWLKLENAYDRIVRVLKKELLR
ncbi:serine hydrolase [Jiulongibacter sediminis]|uniref:serine hydrolase domain-containing protein n=1 Tax=Jiulongibacter sediminis TaxID=1605367 RepID=UPI0026EA1165|nr:serine hydrolase domain-containing protein [Jiulongibacter sediminis]